jgi:5'-3' exonuclease
MGIENFFNTINRHTLFQNNITSSSVNEPIKNITNGEHIYFDFNSIIYNNIQEIEEELNYVLYEIITGHNTDNKTKYLTKYLDLLNVNIEFQSLPSKDDNNLIEKIEKIEKIETTETTETTETLDIVDNIVENIINNIIDNAVKLVQEDKLKDIRINNMNKFKETFNSENIIKILMIKIKNKIKEILFSYNEPNIIKNIYIAIDGTPNMPKIMEQKKRRYIQYIIGEVKKRIMQKYESSFDENRKLFEENIIYVDRTSITSYTSFLNFIYSELSSEQFKNEIYSIIPNLKSLKISSPLEIGEGEKKIMEDINLNNYNGNYVIMSPDADLIILCLIQKNMLNKKSIQNTFQIIRQNMQKETIDVIDIDKLLFSISEYLKKRIEETSIIKFDISMNRVIDDITLLLTLFGNDFMPRLKSINVRNGFNIIFEVYVRHLTRTRNRYKYITFEEENIYKINYDNFNSFLYKLSENEHKLCIETYAASHYKNYSYINSCLESTFGSPYFYDKINAYIHGFNKLMTHILNYKKNNEEVSGDKIYEELLLNYSDKIVFIKQFVAFEAGFSDIKNEEEIKNKCIDQINKIIQEINIYGFYHNKLKFVPYSNTINDKYHQKMIREDMYHPLMLITDYDSTIYKFEKKLDEYHYKFNSEIDDTLGSIEIINRYGFYKLICDNNIEKNKSIYYKEKMNINSEQDKYKLAHSYITGMFWTFDFYFNKNNRENNIKHISIWSYEYDSSPFIQDIINYINSVPNRNKLLNHIFYSVNNTNSNHYVPQILFMNELEQYIYITPYEKIKGKVPENYLTTLQNANFFIDCEEIINGIFEGKATKYIDCGKSAYLNKCSIIGMKKMSCSVYMKTIIKLREE